MAVYGVIIVLVVFFMPTGIVGGLRSIAHKRFMKKSQKRVLKQSVY
jgi:hypothetical protein